MKIVIIDNYDSFTYNLAHLIKELGAEVTVIRNDQFELPELEKFDRIVLSPGPGIPSEAGLLLDVIKYYAGKKPILGVCLGHQAIGEVFGGKLVNLSEVYHGVATPCHVVTPYTHSSQRGSNEKKRQAKLDYLFEGLSHTFNIARYHSWAVEYDTIPDCLEITAESIDHLHLSVMALRHKEFDVRGIQFHPESILTHEGKRMLQNWLNHKPEAPTTLEREHSA